MDINRKRIFRWVKIVLLIYAVIGIVFFYVQDRLLLHPTKMAAGKHYAFSQPFTELDLNYDKETRLNIVEFKATDRPADSIASGVVLFFHGARGNSGDYAAAATGFAARGYEVWIMDYPGFGKSTGPMSEQRLYDLALVFYKLARSRWKPAQIVLYGRGFGTGIAAQLAAVRDCKRLILEDAYYSMTSVFRPYLFIYPLDGNMLHYHLPTNKYLPEVTAPINIIGGSGRLRKFLKPGDTFVETGDPASFL
ncbi:MAG TPA: alpha/beta fold hydrolase [Puia sp.]|nr:alpha/beta fold hydrolase [Puia sp.]